MILKSGVSLHTQLNHTDKMFALVDCNNFYASCERVFQPKLKNKPIVVLSNNDGCVIARSNEAKQLGVPMGAAAFEYKELFDKHNIHVFSSNYALYGDMSNRVMNLLQQYTPEIEIYSIDEAFLQLSGFDYITSAEEYVRDIRYTVTKGTGIPISIGLASTKTLSKVANKIAKKFPEHTQHVYSIDSEEKRLKALKWLPVEDVWGIGRQYAKRLHNAGIRTAYDFTLLPESWIQKYMGIMGVRLFKELSGTPCFAINTPQNKQNIATTRSFDKNITDYKFIRERVVTFAASCAAKLRKQKSCCTAIMVFMHTNYHRKDLPQYSRNILMKLPFPTNSSFELAHFAVQAMDKIFKQGYAYKKAGVIVMDFVPQANIQINLFQNSNPKHTVLMETIDNINNRIGQTKIKLGGQDPGRTWKMRQEQLSPCYTTRIRDIISISC
jgi:DNA polymerase V